MFQQETSQRILQIVDGTIDNALSGFFTDSRTRGLSPRTIDFYEEKLSRFQIYEKLRGAVYLRVINVNVVR